MKDKIKVVAETNRLLLRRYQLGDAKVLHQLLSNKQVMHFFIKPFDLREAENTIIKNIQRYHQGAVGKMAVLLKESGKYIGDAGIVSQWVNDKWENNMMVILHSEIWQRSLGLEAGKACLELAQNQGQKRVVCHMPCIHTAGIALAEALGFEREILYINERHRNVEYFLYAKSLT